MSEALFKIFVESVLDTSKFDKGMTNSATKGGVLTVTDGFSRPNNI